MLEFVLVKYDPPFFFFFTSFFPSFSSVYTVRFVELLVTDIENYCLLYISEENLQQTLPFTKYLQHTIFTK